MFVLFWLKERLNLTEGKVLRFMVDNGITSSLGAFSATGILFGILLTTGSIRIGDFIGDNDPMLILGAILLAAVLIAVAYRFRPDDFLPFRKGGFRDLSSSFYSLHAEFCHANHAVVGRLARYAVSRLGDHVGYCYHIQPAPICPSQRPARSQFNSRNARRR